jgi:putative ABC transport system permease protein
MKRLFRYLRARRFDDQINAEMEGHLNEMIEELRAAGLPPEQARSRALCEFGNRARLAEECRDEWAFASLAEISRDLRYALRMLRRNPVFALVAVVCLSLGIGANTIIFSAIDRILLHPLPYAESDRLISVWSQAQSKSTEHMHVSAADFYDWRSQSRAFKSLAAFASWPMNLTNVDEPRRLQTELVSPDMFEVLRAEPQLGRTFLRGDEQQQNRAVVVLSHHLWRALGEPSIGAELTLNGSAANIIGVMPPGFDFPSPEVDAWVPLALSAENRANREGRWLQVIGRLAPGANLVTAQAEMNVVAHRIATAYPRTNKGLSVSLVPLQDEIVGKAKPVLWTLQGGTLLLLLVTCANIANLLLARSSSRAREIGMRAALGAGRARIVRQLMVESLVLATFGGGCGIALAAFGVRVLRTLAEPLLPRAAEIAVSASVLAVALAATLLTAGLFGLAPALHASCLDLRDQISAASRSTSWHADRKRGLLVSVEIAIAVVLLVGAGLLGASLTRLLSTPTGLRIDHLLTLRLTLSHSQYPTNQAQNAIFERILDRLGPLPGVVSAAAISDTPLGGNNPTFEFALDPSEPRPESPVRAGLRAISPGYFDVAGIALLRGRPFSAGDRAESPPLAIVNQTMARRSWPGVGDPTGRKVRLKEENRWMIVTAVVPDGKHMGLTSDEGPVVYIPYAQKTQDWMAWTTLLVRTAIEPLDLAPAIRRAIREVDKNQPVTEVGTLEQQLARSTATPRFTTTSMGLISGFSLLIAVIGVYGLLAYTVSQRIPELGIRLALGASPIQVSWLLLRQAMMRVIIGVGCGLLIAWWAASILESQLFGIRPNDPRVFAAVGAFLVIISALAVLAPALRAMTIDPSVALRAD